jgi:hypothetical protein
VLSLANTELQSERVILCGQSMRSPVRFVVVIEHISNWYSVFNIGITCTNIIGEDEDGNIKGGFYKEELLKTKYKDLYLIEQVLQKKG